MALPDIYTEGIASGWKVIDGAKLSAPQTLEADVAESESSGARAGIRFFKDGSSSGGTLRFVWNERRDSIDVNWLTGNVAINGL